MEDINHNTSGETGDSRRDAASGDFYNLPPDVFRLITYNDKVYNRYWYDPVAKRLIKKVWNRYRYVKINSYIKNKTTYRFMQIQDKYGNHVAISYNKFIDYIESDAAILQGNRPVPVSIDVTESSDSSSST